VLSHPVLQLLKALQGIRGEQQRNNTALYYTMTARDTQQRDISTSTLTSHLHVYLALQSDFHEFVQALETAHNSCHGVHQQRALSNNINAATHGELFNHTQPSTAPHSPQRRPLPSC
jgi:hypothetical protein